MPDTSLGASRQKNLPLWLVHSLMLCAAMIVSGSFTVGAAITHELDPAVLLLIRYLVAVCCLAPVIFWRYGHFRPSLRQLGGYSMVSICTVGFFWCMFTSLRYTTAMNTSIIFTLVPGISGVYSALFLGERLGSHRLVALVCGMVGAIWVIFRGDLGRLLALEVNQGDLLFLAGCFLMAGYTPLVKTFHRQESMVVMTFWVLVTGLGWLMLLALPRLSEVVWPAISVKAWAGILYLAVLSTIITFYLTHLSTLYLGPTRVMAYSYFYPSFVLVLNWLLGHGLPPAMILPGVVVVSLAIIVLQHGARESQTPHDRPLRR
ncbi:MAG: EamA/RhaT family transporter [Desulfobulbaceae bacterium]|nr:MAG: EamA/RhaT family transporter [Desulfobulbaceae bacterium]